MPRAPASVVVPGVASHFAQHFPNAYRGETRCKLTNELVSLERFSQAISTWEVLSEVRGNLKITNTPAGARGTVADLRAAAAAADPSWDSMSGERESRGRLCEHIARF